MAKRSLRIKLEAYDHTLIDETAKKIVDAARKSGSIVSGPIPLPTEKEVFTIIRAPHGDKHSREQFERRTHKRLINLENVTDKTFTVISALTIPNGVELRIKQIKG
jgi:small subunit ribosomal protein S10